MKKIIVLIFAGCICFCVSAQIVEPVKWTTSVEKVSDTEYVLVSTANIDAGWHLYSQKVKKDGPIATKFTYNDKKYKFKLVGNSKEGKGHVEYDKIYRMKIKYFEDKAVFRQRIQFLKAPKVKTITGVVRFMSCDNSRCLPPTEVDLDYNLTIQK